MACAPTTTRRSSKRKRGSEDEDEEEGSEGGGKRRSEEPLVRYMLLEAISLNISFKLHFYRIQKPFVDETVVEEDDVSLEKEKNTVVLKENVVKASLS